MWLLLMNVVISTFQHCCTHLHSSSFTQIMNNPPGSPNRNTNRLLDKTVRFAPTSHVRTFKAIGTEDATKSHKQDDYGRFLIERHRDIFTCLELVARTWNSREPLSLEEICLCTGIEAYLAPNVARRVRKLTFARKIHTTHVLMVQAQARHFEIGDCIEDIARVSMKFSRATVARAVEVATAAAAVANGAL
jgi:hypothetical protein